MPPKKGKVNIIKSKKSADVDKNKKTNVKNTKIAKTKEKGIVSADDTELDKELSIDEASTVSSIEESDYENLSDQDVESVNGEETGEGDESEEETEEAEESEAEESERPEETEIAGEGDEDNCFYKYVTKKKNNIEEDDFEDEEEMVFDDDNKVFDEIVKPEDRVTKPFLTKFERVRLLGDRAKQLSLGAKPMLKNTELLNPKEIARLELEKKVIPLIIERTLPNGKKERWHVSELKH